MEPHQPDCDSFDTEPDGIKKPCNCRVSWADCTIRPEKAQDKATIEKLRDMIAGKATIMSDDELDLLSHLDSSNAIRSMPNPKQVGTKDRWLCWIEQRDVKRLKLETP